MRKIDKRRRREGKTNYNKRLILLKGGVPRLVVRKTNNYVILQIVESVSAQDKIINVVSTKDLLKHGWPEEKKGSLKSLAAAYLAGLLIGNKLTTGTASKGAVGHVGKVILDSGLIPSTKGSRVYAAVKGLMDSGVEISASEDVLPSEEMINRFDFFEKVREGLK